MTTLLPEARLRILPLGCPILRQRATAVTDLPALGDVFLKMIGYCVGGHSPEGNVQALGLALPQIGISQRGFVFQDEAADGQPPAFTAVVNPELLSSDGDAVPFLEGCESIPGFRATIWRKDRIHVRYTDGLNGEPRDRFLSGLPARIFQHECDHLNGELITDLCSRNDERRGRIAINQAQRLAKKFANHENQS